MDNLVVHKNLKIKGNTNIVKPVNRYEITHLNWDLRTRIIKMMVTYYLNDEKVLEKGFEFDGDEVVDVDNLIEEIKKLHE